MASIQHVDLRNDVGLASHHAICYHMWTFCRRSGITPSSYRASLAPSVLVRRAGSDDLVLVGPSVIAIVNVAVVAY